MTRYGLWVFSKFRLSVHPSSWLFRLLIHPQIPSPFTFHVSELRFVSCFHFTSHFHSPCSISVPQTLTLVYARFPLPWHDSLQYLYIPNLIYVSQSEIHWLSLELPVQTSKPLSVSRPKFEDSRCLVAQHISWSQRCSGAIYSKQQVENPFQVHIARSVIGGGAFVMTLCNTNSDLRTLVHP